ncbi:hypothetical protein ABH931_005023 [Streptacidiphilus sp. MAP12-33]|uniref:hypothetical protein n=1 Tax=Streptacidiphilus sp. MAP12-33 TaxID=3156266 RepID=UPI003512A4BB
MLGTGGLVANLGILLLIAALATNTAHRLDALPAGVAGVATLAFGALTTATGFLLRHRAADQS